MVPRSGKEVDSKVSETEHDKEKGLKTMESDLEIEKENDPSPSPIVSDPTVTYTPYPQALYAQLPSKKDNQRDDILETFKQVKVNRPLLKAIRQIPTYPKFFKDICTLCTFKRKSKDDKLKKVLLSKQVSSILKCDNPCKFKDPSVPTISRFIDNHKIEKDAFGFAF